MPWWENVMLMVCTGKVGEGVEEGGSEGSEGGLLDSAMVKVT